MNHISCYALGMRVGAATITAPHSSQHDGRAFRLRSITPMCHVLHLIVDSLYNCSSFSPSHMHCAHSSSPTARKCPPGIVEKAGRLRRPGPRPLAYLWYRGRTSPGDCFHLSPPLSSDSDGPRLEPRLQRPSPAPMRCVSQGHPIPLPQSPHPPLPLPLPQHRFQIPTL